MTPDQTPEPYTDADLLNQLDAEIETFLDLWEGEEALTRTLLEGFRRKIEAQRSGKKWWELDPIPR